MFAVIYRAFIKEHQENEFQEYWRAVAEYFTRERGALGSTLHKTPEGMWVAYSRWPDQKTRDASWPSEEEAINSELPVKIQQAIQGIKECIDPDRKFPDICMEIVEEITENSLTEKKQ